MSSVFFVLGHLIDRAEGDSDTELVLSLPLLPQLYFLLLHTVCGYSHILFERAVTYLEGLSCSGLSSTRYPQILPTLANPLPIMKARRY